MKIHITTVFKAENCGSFLQAWALKEQLSSMGNEVRFSDYKSPISSANRFYNAFKCFLKLKFKRGKNLIQRTLVFKKYQKELKASKETANLDLCIFGSDTLWNFEDKFFVKNADFFTGANLSKPCYAYSISIGSTSREDFLKNYEAIAGIKKFKKIAVRDAHTQNVLSEIYPPQNIVKTVDPTMLLDSDVYAKKFLPKQTLPEKSLLIYYFGDIPENVWKQLKIFAQKKGLKFVNLGAYENKYDVSIPSSPGNFVSAFANADYIFTNTFHGCIFSIIFNKRFATNGRHKKKIQGLLEEFSLSDRFVCENQDVGKVLTTTIDYDYVNALIKNNRESSVAYLTDVINEVECNE